jgi:hypothetical protein
VSACQRATHREVQHIRESGTHPNKTSSFFPARWRWHASQQNYFTGIIHVDPTKLPGIILLANLIQVGTHLTKLFILFLLARIQTNYYIINLIQVGTHLTKLFILFLLARIQTNYLIYSCWHASKQTI